MCAMRVVFDTNVIVSALLFEESVPATAFFKVLQQGEVLISGQLMNEVQKILQRKKFDRYLSIDEREAFLIALVQTAALIEPSEVISVCRDPDDNMILELAVSGKAQVIVSGDSDLLVLHPFQGIDLLTPQAFLEKYGK